MTKKIVFLKQSTRLRMAGSETNLHVMFTNRQYQPHPRRQFPLSLFLLLLQKTTCIQHVSVLTDEVGHHFLLYRSSTCFKTNIFFYFLDRYSGKIVQFKCIFFSLILHFLCVCVRFLNCKLATAQLCHFFLKLKTKQKIILILVKNLTKFF